jgi:hypothetical protein
MREITLNVQDGQPLDLELQKLATASAGRETVAVTLPVCVPGLSRCEFEIRVNVHLEEAVALRAQLVDAIDELRLRIRSGG